MIFIHLINEIYENSILNDALYPEVLVVLRGVKESRVRGFEGPGDMIKNYKVLITDILEVFRGLKFEPVEAQRRSRRRGHRDWIKKDVFQRPQALIRLMSAPSLANFFSMAS